MAIVEANNHLGVEPKLGTAELLFRCALRMGFEPVWVVPDNTFALWLNGKERYVNLAHSPLNSDTSVALAKNKYLTRCILERHHVRNIPFLSPRTQEEALAFLEQHTTIIAKPIDGAGAQDIHIITHPAQLNALNLSCYILEKYIVGKEFRYLLLNDDVIAVHRSDYGMSVAYDRPLQRISYPPGRWPQDLVDSSLHVARILNLKFAAVDYLVDSLGVAHILEVNTVPGLKWFHAPTKGPAVDVARLFLESIIDDVPQSVLSDLLAVEQV